MTRYDANAVKATGRWAISFGILALLLSVLGMSAVGYVRFHRSGEGGSAAPVHASKVRTGVQHVAVFLVSSTCGASRYPDLPKALAVIRAREDTQATREGKTFISVGVALDDDPSIGLAFLKTFGNFDQLSVGGNWLNAMAIDLLIRDTKGPLSLPQLIVLERTVTVGPAAIQVGQDRVMGRYIGFDDILGLAGMRPSKAGARIQ